MTMEKMKTDIPRPALVLQRIGRLWCCSASAKKSQDSIYSRSPARSRRSPPTGPHRIPEYTPDPPHTQMTNGDRNCGTRIIFLEDIHSQTRARKRSFSVRSTRRRPRPRLRDDVSSRANATDLGPASTPPSPGGYRKAPTRRRASPDFSRLPQRAAEQLHASPRGGEGRQPREPWEEGLPWEEGGGEK